MFKKKAIIEFMYLYCPHCHCFHHFLGLKIENTIIDGKYISCKKTNKIITGILPPMLIEDIKK